VRIVRVLSDEEVQHLVNNRGWHWHWYWVESFDGERPLPDPSLACERGLEPAARMHYHFGGISEERGIRPIDISL
jgi:hypothetical protein